jgi:hypothetical protein
MTMRPGTTPWESAEEEYRNIDVAVVGANEVVGAALEGQLLFTDAIHFSRSRYRYL